MFHFKWIGASLLIAAILVTWSHQVQARVQKSGTVSLQRAWHYEGTAQRYSDNLFKAAFRYFGVQYGANEQAFGHGMSFQCLGFDEVSDLRKGTYPNRLSSCVLKDSDGDLILTWSACATSSWSDWCSGEVIGGTGKYKGITGKLQATDGASTIRRECLVAPKAEDCRTYDSGFQTTIGTTYRIEGEGIELLEIEWRIP